MEHTKCLGCAEPIARAWQPLDPALAQYHAGCRPGAGRIPYVLPTPAVDPDPFDARGEFDAYDVRPIPSAFEDTKS
jgi:hypothetical protein